MWWAAARGVASALFPSTCVGCGRRGTDLCEPCRLELPYLPDGVCGRCAGLRSAGGTCRGCRRLSPALKSIRAPFAYAGAARTAVLGLKFQSRRSLAPLMGMFLGVALTARPFDADLVVPVPLAARRFRQRGYNQAALLAEHVAGAAGACFTPTTLTRAPRPPQQTLSAAERLRNLGGSIQCSGGVDVADHRVLLVDDVMTTGATLSACAEALVEAGARRVGALVFARDL